MATKEDQRKQALLELARRELAARDEKPSFLERAGDFMTITPEGLKRQAGLTLRAGVESVADAAAPFADPLAATGNMLLAGYDKLRGAEQPGFRFPFTSANMSQALTRAGLPEPEGGLEKLSNVGGRILGSGIVSAPFSAAAATRAGFSRPSPNAPGPLRSSPGAQAGAGAEVSGNPTAQVTGGGSGFGQVGDDASAGLTASQRRIMDSGRRMGMRTTPGQATGSRSLQQLEAKLESQPFTSGTFNAIKENNTRVLNRAVAQSIGRQADEVSSDVLSDAAESMHRMYRQFADDTPRAIDPDDFLNRLGGIESDLRGIVDGFAEHPLVKDLMRLASSGQATGRQLHALGSQMGKAANSQMTSQQGNRELGIALFKVKDYVDDVMQSTMDAGELASFGALRNEWRNYANLIKRTNVVNPSTGNVNGVSLANMLQKSDKSGFLLGKNKTPMYEAARFYQAFKPIVGDSGTATRSMITNPTDVVLSAPFRAAAGAYVRTPPELARGLMRFGEAGSGVVRQLPPQYWPPIGGAAASQMLDTENRRRAEALRNR